MLDNVLNRQRQRSVELRQKSYGKKSTYIAAHNMETVVEMQNSLSKGVDTDGTLYSYSSDRTDFTDLHIYEGR